MTVAVVVTVEVCRLFLLLCYYIKKNYGVEINITDHLSTIPTVS